ncbi:MAG: M20/M25/M40 family metallo-hydrolase [Defluviitaleaceae bacterium]|nr:M20/M25/M40 family metallo-hydrolase [Defluviitaleaceae bacterium]
MQLEPKTQNSRLFRRLFWVFNILALGLGIYFGIMQVRPLAANEASAEFMTMMANIRQWAIPRPMTSMNLRHVRNGIIREIEGMGLRPEVQEIVFTENDIRMARYIATGHRSFLDVPLSDAFHNEFTIDGRLYLYNILTRLESATSDRVVLFVSHYDTMPGFPGTPGAADAMLPIAAMLEAMRELSQMDALNRNVYFLMTDAEEYWAMGALAFVRENPELRDRVDMVINLEAVGNAGALVLFQTSPRPSEIVRFFGTNAPRPVGFSFAPSIYESMSFWTDFCVFLYYGWLGINLAITKGQEHYHQLSDTYQNLNRDAAYNYLQTVLSLARAAAEPPNQRNPSESIFFPFYPGNLLIISRPAAYALGIAISILAALCIHLNRNKKLTIIKLSIPLLLSIASLILFHTASYLFWLPLFFAALSTLCNNKPKTRIILSALAAHTLAILWTPVLYLLSDFLATGFL